MRLVDPSHLRSLSGERLSLRNVRVRLVYLDEAGISNPSHEPYLVIAGVIVSGNQDWHPLERHILSLKRKYLPREDIGRVVFSRQRYISWFGLF